MGAEDVIGVVRVPLVFALLVTFASEARAADPVKPAPAAPAPSPAPAPAPAPAAKPKPTTGPSEDADPPPIPPPKPAPAPPSASAPAAAGSEPTSTSGTLLLPPPSAAPPAPLPAVVPAAPVAPARVDADGAYHALETRLAATEAQVRDLDERLGYLRNLRFRGYVQPQLLIQSFNDAASPNAVNGQLPAGISANQVTAKPDGTSTNGTFFRIRRTRLITEYATEYMRLTFDFDPNLSGGAVAGTGTIARTVEGVGIAHYTPTLTQEFAMGIFKVPFGFEVMQSDADRPYIERSWGEQNMFPGEFDTGARTKVTALDSRLQVHAAVVNGITIGEKTFAIVPDLNHGKDVTGRANFDFGPADVGVSGYYGTGQNVDAKNLAIKQFTRSALNAEVALHHGFVEKLGMTKAFAELTYGENMDRGTKYGFGLPQIQPDINAKAACGNRAGSACNELSYFVRLEQDITHWVTAGARFDSYTTDIEIGNNARETWAFLGVMHFTKGLQLMAEYDYAKDNIHAQGAAAPGKQIHLGSFVFQARF